MNYLTPVERVWSILECTKCGFKIEKFVPIDPTQKPEDILKEDHQNHCPTCNKIMKFFRKPAPAAQK